MTQRKTYRIHQINRQLQEEIASILLLELEDEALKDLTVTEVRTSKDLHHAQVFATTRKSANRENALMAARKAAGLIRKLLFSRLRLKYIPMLDFRYDESLDRAERIFQALDSIEQDESPIMTQEQDETETQ